jgi:uncharacterized protein YggE
MSIPKTIVLLVTLALAFQVHAQTQPELKGSPAELAQFLNGVPKTVTITGEGEIKKTADRAIITLKVTTENKSLQEAMRLNQDVRAKIVDYLKLQNIPADRVQAAKFSSTPNFGWFSEKAKSYRIENSVKITVSDEKEFQAASGTVDKWSEVQYAGLEFEHINKEQLKKDVVAKACDNATERRKIYEEKFGVKLVAKGISEGTVGLNTSATFGRNKYYAPGASAITAGPARNVGYASNTPAEEADSALEGLSPFGEVIYTARITVEYAVEAK